MKQIKGYAIPASGSPVQIPDAPVRALSADGLGFTTTAYLEIELDDAGQPNTPTMILAQVIAAAFGISDDWTWLASTADGKRHLYKVTDADAAS